MIDGYFMPNDGGGSSIRIPSVLISKDDGEKLIDFVETASKQDVGNIFLTAQFELRSPDNRVEYDVWYSSSNDKALDFIQAFGQYDEKFGDQVLMTPHFVFDQCIMKDCTTEYKKLNCFANGLYCAKDFKHPNLNGR